MPLVEFFQTVIEMGARPPTCAEYFYFDGTAPDEAAEQVAAAMRDVLARAGA